MLTKSERQQALYRSVKFICKGLRPFTAIKDEGLEDLLQVGHPDLTLSYRQTLKEKTILFYGRAEDRLCALLGKTIGPISLTIHMWSNEQAESLMGVTAHFVTSDGSIGKHDAMLDLAIASERTTSDALWRQLDAILHEFGIQENIGTITIDNGCNMVQAMEDLAFSTAATRPTVLRCAADSINLAVKEGLAVITDDIDTIRSLVIKVKRSNYYSRLLKLYETQNEERTTELVRDVVTRWNSVDSTCQMLRRASESRRSLQQLVESEPGLRQFQIPESSWQYIDDVTSLSRGVWEGNRFLKRHAVPDSL